MYASQWTTLSPLGVQALKSMDRSRQARGRMMEQAGHGPQETPSTVLHAEPGLNLRRYGGAADAPPVLLVPAPIKRSYIWDLAPATSVVRRWLERGWRVYLAEWTPLPEGEAGRDFGFDDYADRLLAACRRAIAADGDHAAGRPVIAGHSLGGILAAIHSALYPDALRATVLLEAPLHFAPATCCFHPLVRAVPDARAIADAFGQVPGAFLNMMSALAEPQAFGWERLQDRWMALADPDREAIATYLRVERWTHDEFPLPGRLFTQIVEALYRGDELMQGRLRVGGRAVGPADLRAPLASVMDPRSKVIPQEAVVPFHEAAGAAAQLLLRYGGDVGVNLQHVGVLVGRQADATLWPAIFAWLDGLPVQPGRGAQSTG
ncbi:alpha/beta hydrolase [uncultured Massilia sp.]|uniref:alpha/beta hydrolase n=1 Tax=uncultured Massilia sp. TaxID=169973 RepID=UPI0025F378A7|nr:alpha/beta hydrolase [uncultured Massilia sp.]